MTEAQNGSISIVLADDHGIVRAGLRALLEMQPDMAVVGEAEDGGALAAAAFGWSGSLTRGAGIDESEHVDLV